jgi:hypothetical protein
VTINVLIVQSLWLGEFLEVISLIIL